MKNKLQVFAWSFYDFANTIFSMNIISLYFALWVTIDKKAEDLFYSLALSASIFLAGIFEPIMGAISDQFRRRMPFLVFFTLLCILFTSLMGLAQTLVIGLLFFGVANFGYQLAGIFYNSLLPSIAQREKLGRVSGYGVSLGYVGTIAGLVMVKPFVDMGGRQAAFFPTAVLFLLFSLPCFLLVKEKRESYVPNVSLKLKARIKQAFANLKQTFLHSRQYPGLFPFIVAAFLALNAINTLIIFMSVYAKKVILLSDTEIIRFLILSTVFAILGSFFSGYVTDRIGPKRTLSLIFALWCLVFGIVALTFNKSIFWIVGPLAGISLGSTWVVSRVLAIELAPQDKIGEIFGIFGLAGKTSSIIGPLVWGGIIWLFAPLGIVRYRLAVVAMCFFVIAGFTILQRVPSKR